MALACVAEYFLADGNWPLYFTIYNDIMIHRIEGQINHIEVISTIDIADHWNPVDEHMRCGMSVTLDYPMYCVVW